MKKKLLIILPIVTVLLAGIAYFFVVPAVQVDSYKDTSRSHQLALAGSVTSAISASNQNAFFKSDITLPEAQNAVKVCENALAELTTKIESGETPLTTLAELPVLSATNANYKAAINLKGLEKEYVEVAKEYAAEFKLVTQYNKDSLAIVEMSEDVEKAGANLQKATSKEELVSAIDQLIKTLESGLDVVNPLTPPASVKQIHDLNVNGIRELVVIMKQLKAAILAMDMEKMMSAQAAFTEKLDALSSETKKLTEKQIRESKLTKLGDKLTALNKQIEIENSKL